MNLPSGANVLLRRFDGCPLAGSLFGLLKTNTHTRFLVYRTSRATGVQFPAGEILWHLFHPHSGFVVDGVGRISGDTGISGPTGTVVPACGR